ncbi:hypothetical protein COCC4DRAFT_63520 [Bipolaris maydis ATCC 48331]|uniref:Uncharacterized protein n=2 Tax=Cochliobolus heterostrophus TaxID=5016 RepID=M2UVQ6_COCH5|nr:uncharacterized protein COCC4DRAFT_63520 [Bipolaris maydis ATCC 48331]EMD91918.1 hypothetical protein COCHEDRAFT_1154939 [Bipolaris maydis C5]ENI02599.1 hypothetical protein COCC4DRAFT_63520 [Bipolaris maydis ATCC 48331]
MQSSVDVHTSRTSLTPAVLTLQHPTIFSITSNDIATAKMCEAALWLAGTRKTHHSVISNKKQTTDRLAMQPHMNRGKNIPRFTDLDYRKIPAYTTAGSAGIPWLKALLTEVRERASTSTGPPTTPKAVGDTER